MNKPDGQTFIGPQTTIRDTAVDLLTNAGVEGTKIRLLGISVSNFDGARETKTNPDNQGRLFL